MSTLKSLAIDWGRIEVWCEHSSGKSICGPVLDHVRTTAEGIERERDALQEALIWVAENYPKAMREMPRELFQPLRIQDPFLPIGHETC